MSADVVSLRENKGLHASQIHNFFAQADEANYQLLPKYYQSAQGLVAHIGVLDSQIAETKYERDRAFEHVHRESDHVRPSPIFSPGKLGILLLAVMAGEVVLAKTVSAAFYMPDYESWLIAFGLVGVTALGAALAGHGGKRACDDWYSGRRANPEAVASLLIGVMALGATVYGMMQARTAYFEALEGMEEIPVGSGLITNGALTFLQLGIVIALTGLFWVNGGSRAQKAADQAYRQAKRKISKLLKERAHLEANLTRLYSTLESEWNRNIAYGRRIIFEYCDELHLQGVHVPLFEVNSADFAPLPPQILAPQIPERADQISRMPEVTTYPDADENLDVISGRTRRPRLK